MPVVINKEKVRCPRCSKHMVPALAMSGGESDFWLRCSDMQCVTFVDTFIPLQHQAILAHDPARYVLIAGGYGSGKTMFDIKDAQKHFFITPNGSTLLGAPTQRQLKRTILKDFENDFPVEFVDRQNKQDMVMFTTNNHEIQYTSFDDPHKLRSLNISRAIVVEASGAKYSVFTQLQNRLRNAAAWLVEKDKDGNDVYYFNEKGQFVPKVIANWTKITMETNPDPGWVRSKGLLESGTIYLHGDAVDQEYNVDLPKASTAISTHIIPTSANYMLAPGWQEEQSQGKPKWWVDRYFKGSFLYSEGLIYPNIMSHVVKPFSIPKNWKRIIAMDYGINDNTHFVFGAVDPKNHICYLFHEIVMSGASVKTLSNQYKKDLKLHVPHGSLLRTPVMDAISRNKRLNHDTQRTLVDLFEDEGLIFDPAQMNIDARIMQGKTLFDSGQLKIFSTCVGLIKEGMEYRFPEKELDKPGKNTDKPEDKNNHGMNAMEFLVMELPYNLELMDHKSYNKNGVATAYHSTEPEDIIAAPKRFNPFQEKSNTDFIFHGGDIDDSDSNYNDHMFHNPSDW